MWWGSLKLYICINWYVMEITVNIKEQKKIATCLNFIKEIDYIEIVNLKEESQELPAEHLDLLDKRLQKLENGETTSKD